MPAGGTCVSAGGGDAAAAATARRLTVERCEPGEQHGDRQRHRQTRAQHTQRRRGHGAVKPEHVHVGDGLSLQNLVQRVLQLRGGAERHEPEEDGAADHSERPVLRGALA
jgi:hypothetical protein